MKRYYGNHKTKVVPAAQAYLEVSPTVFREVCLAEQPFRSVLVDLG